MTVKGYVDRVVVVARGQVVAAHPRSYGRHAPVLDPIHYLITLGRKPAALDHAPVYRDWNLPTAFLTLRAELKGYPESRFDPRIPVGTGVHPFAQPPIRQCVSPTRPT